MCPSDAEIDVWREQLVSASCMPVYIAISISDQLVTPVTTIGLVIWVVVLCPFPASSLGWPCPPAVAFWYCEQGKWVFTHMRVGPVGYHNKMRQLESTCDRRLWLCWLARQHLCLCLICLHGTGNLFTLFSTRVSHFSKGFLAFKRNRCLIS